MRIHPSTALSISGLNGPGLRPGVALIREIRIGQECACWVLRVELVVAPSWFWVSRGPDGYPCRCLWRRFSQITMTRPWRRITLHLSQIALTLGLTFTVSLLLWHDERDAAEAHHSRPLIGRLTCSDKRSARG